MTNVMIPRVIVKSPPKQAGRRGKGEKRMPLRIAIIGGGIHGTLAALNLARLGASCDVFEARPQLWAGATFAGEGKIHLGYVYGRADKETLVSLLSAAQGFSEDLEFALQRPLNWSCLTSSTFEYGVPSSSLLTPVEFQEHTEHLRTLVDQNSRSKNVSYLGAEIPLNKIIAEKTCDKNRFHTPERSVDVPALRTLMTEAISESSNISLRMSTEVTNTNFSAGKWWLTSCATTDGTQVEEPYDLVVNCAWENSALLDRQSGGPIRPLPNLRLRLFVHAMSFSTPRALTLTLGPFGDYVAFPNGRTYASWYPSGLRGFSEALQPPTEWTETEKLSGDDPGYVDSVVNALSDWVPDISLWRNPSVHARIVVAAGSTDIDNPTSQLHQRAGYGLEIKDTWISVRSFKLTTAPAAARMVYNHVKGLLT